MPQWEMQQPLVDEHGDILLGKLAADFPSLQDIAQLTPLTTAAVTLTP